MPPFVQHWITQFLDSIPNFFTALGILVVGLYLASLSAKVLRKIMDERRAMPYISSLLSHVLYWTIAAVTVIMALQRFFDVTAFLAGLGILGFTVGFALQDVMKNFAAGIILLLQQPFTVGESISVAGFDGTILAIDLRATEMRTLDGRLVSIPNGTVLTNPIVNYTRASQRRVDLPLEVPAGADLETIRKIVMNAILSAPGIVKEPAPEVVFQQIGRTSLKLTGSFWVDVSKGDPDLAKDAVLRRIQTDFAQQKVMAPVVSNQ